MSNLKKDTDNILRNKLAELEINPPPEVWENISGALAPKKKILPFFWKIAAGIVIASGMLTGYFLINKSGSITENQVVSEVKQPPVTTNNNPENQNQENKQMDSPPLKKVASEAITPKIKKSNPSQTTGYSQHQQNTITKPISQNETSIFQVNHTDLEKAIPLDSYEVSSDLTLNARSVPVNFTNQEKTTKEDEQKKAETLDLLLADNTTDVDEGKWSLGGAFSPFVGGNDESGTGNLGSQSNSWNQGSINQDDLLAYSGGLNVNLKLGKRLSLESGVHYSRMGRQLNNIYGTLSYTESTSNMVSENTFYAGPSALLNAQVNSDKRLEYEYSFDAPQDANYVVSDRGSKAIDGYIKQNVEYIEIPLILKYKIIDRKIDFNLLGGLNTNILFGNKAFVKSEGNSMSIESSTHPDPITYSSTFGVGFEYGIFNNVNLNLEPVLKYYLTPDRLPAFIGDKAYRLGLYTGIYYSF